MKKSKIGITLVLLYLITTLIIWIYANTCSDMYCGLILILPTMPWALLFEKIIGDSVFIFFILITLNSVIIYSFGWLISWLISWLIKNIKS